MISTILHKETRLSAPVTIFKGASLTKPAEVITFADLIEKINTASPEEAKTLQKLKQTDPDGYTSQKKKLLAFSSGRFNYRSSKGLEEYSPLMFFDLDEVPKDLLAFVLDDCKKDPFIYTAFPSPSGEGIRIGIWTNATRETHQDYYKAICCHLRGNLNLAGSPSEVSESKPGYVDLTTSDISRIWFFTYVKPGYFYLNSESEVFSLGGALPPEAGADRRRPAGKNPPAGRYREEFTHREKVETLIASLEKNRIDITQGVENWFRIGCALVSEFGEEARPMFHRVSQFHQAYRPEDCDREFNRCLQKQPKGGIKIATFYEACKGSGVLVDLKAIKEARASQRKDQPGDEQSPPPGPVLKVVKTKEIEVAKEITLPEEKPENLQVQDGCYTWNARGTKKISNFLIDPLYLLKDAKNPKRIWRMVNRHGEEAMLYIPVRSIAKPADLEAEIEGKGNFIPSWNKEQFSAIKEVLYSQEKEAQEIPVLGFQPDTGFYAFCNGVIDGGSFIEINRFGIVETSKGVYYIPALSDVNKDDRGEFTNDRKFKFLPSETFLDTWTRLFCDVHGENAQLGICFLIAALYRDLIFRHLETFPMLFLFGPKGTGKTTFREGLMSVFGIPQPAISLGSASSPKGFARKLGQYSNALISFEEYKNGIDKRLIEMLKSLYDGIGYERALMTNDNKTHSSPVLSAVVLAGQELPTKENALFSRAFILEFSIESREDKTRYNRLKEMENEGLGLVLFELIQFRDLLEKGFREAFNQVIEDFRRDPLLSNLTDRAKSNAAAIIAPFKVISSNKTFPFCYSDVLTLTKRHLVEQNEIQARTTEVNQFWQVFTYLVRDGKIFKRDYEVDENANILYLTTSVFAKYKKFAPEQGIQTVDLETLAKYLKQQPYFLKPSQLPNYKGQQGGRDQIKKKIDGNGAWCYCFDYGMLKEIFEIDLFYESTGNLDKDPF